MRRYFRKLRLVLAAVVTGGISIAATAAQAQYPRYNAQQQAPNPYQWNQQAPAYPTTAAPQPQFAPVQQSYGPTYVPPSGYAAQPPVGPAVGRMAMAHSPDAKPHELPMPSEAAVPEAPKQGGALPYPSTGYPNTSDSDRNNSQSSWEGYMQSGSNNTDECYGCDNGYGIGDYCEPVRSRQWFFGAYALYMDRDDPGVRNLTLAVDNPASYPHYPPVDRTIMTGAGADADWQWGAEIRFGSTFGCAQTCGCQTYQPFAWEVGYWGLAEDDAEVTVGDDVFDSDRFYGMVNFAGLQYDRDGVGGAYDWQPVNNYYDYQMPIEDPMDPDTNQVVVLAQRARSSFSAQNVELNFIRFPFASYAGCYDGCVGCNDCGPVAPRFSMNGVCGVRYLRLDEDFQYDTYFTNWPAVPSDPQVYPGGFSPFDDNALFYDISLDNHLVGFQLGSSMNWAISCRWSAFCDTTLGIYNNHIEQYQRLYNESGGWVRFAGSGQDFSVRSTKDDVAFLGEARLGLGYQITDCWRLTTAYRVIAISGVAVAVEQIPDSFANYESVAYIDSNESLVLHGVQFGAEMKY